MKKRDDYLIVILSAILIFLVFGFLNEFGAFKPTPEKITGRATTSDVTTSAEIANYFAISASSNMSTDGIVFHIASLPATDTNATGNKILNSTDNSELYFDVDTDSNVNVDYCIKANDSLRTGGNVINLGNYTWNSSTVNNATHPHIGRSATNATALTTVFTNADKNIAAGQRENYRFYLSAVGTQAAGTYLNKVNFKGIQTGNSC